MQEDKPLLKSFSDFFDKKKQEVTSDQQLVDAIKKDLEALYPKIRQFYSAYSESSVQSLVNHYAHLKYRFIKSADYYRRTAENQLLEYRPQAEECFWQIQQKKLFNLQCQWRAGSITLPGIDTTFDFMKWEHDIAHCPCLPPVTQDEVDLYIRYLHSPNCDVGGPRLLYNWQDYNTYKSSYQKEEEDILPSWYSFYDTYMGTTALLSLPDVKSEKEQFYRRLLAQRKKEEQIKAGTYKEPPPYVPPKPFLNYFDQKTLVRFVREFETSENQELFFNFQHVNYQPSREDEYLNERLETILHTILYKAKEHIPVEAHDDWRQAVIRAAEAYERKKIAEALPSVFEEYCFRLEAGITLPPLEKNPYDWVDQFKQEILDGRAANGEPRDFNY